MATYRLRCGASMSEIDEKDDLEPTADAPARVSQDAEAAYEASVGANLKRNYLSMLAHGLFGMTGFRLLNAPTFLPAYIFCFMLAMLCF